MHVTHVYAVLLEQVRQTRHSPEQCSYFVCLLNIYIYIYIIYICIYICIYIYMYICIYIYMYIYICIYILYIYNINNILFLYNSQSACLSVCVCCVCPQTPPARLVKLKLCVAFKNHPPGKVPSPHFLMLFLGHWPFCLVMKYPMHGFPCSQRWHPNSLPMTTFWEGGREELHASNQYFTKPPISSSLGADI